MRVKLVVSIAVMVFMFTACLDSAKKEATSPNNIMSHPIMKFNTTKSTAVNTTKNIGISADVASVTPSSNVDGIYANGINAVAWSKNTTSTYKTSNNFAYYPSVTYDNGFVAPAHDELQLLMGEKYSLYNFMDFGFPDKDSPTVNVVLLHGDIADASSYQNQKVMNAKNYSSFDSDYYENVDYFTMDFIELSVDSIGLIWNTAGKEVLYGNGVCGPINFGTNVNPNLQDMLYKYPQFTVPLVNDNLDPTYRVRSGIGILSEDNTDTIDYSSFTVLYVNAKLLDPSRKAGTLMYYVGGDPRYGDLTTAEQTTINDFLESTNNDCQSQRQLIAIIPYAMKKIPMKNGVADAETIAEPTVSILFDLDNVISQGSLDGYTAYNDIRYFVRQGITGRCGILINTNDAGYPFGLDIKITDKATIQ